MRFYCGRRQEDELLSAQWILATLKYTYFPLKQIMWTQRGSRGKASWRRREQPSQPPGSLVEKNKTFFFPATLLPNFCLYQELLLLVSVLLLAFELNVSVLLSSYIGIINHQHLMQSSFYPRGKCIGQFCNTNLFFSIADSMEDCQFETPYFFDYKPRLKSWFATFRCVLQSSADIKVRYIALTYLLLYLGFSVLHSIVCIIRSFL